MKKLLALLLALLMLCTMFAACSKKDDVSDDTAADTGAAADEPKDETYDYSAGLEANGFFEGVKATDYVTLCELPIKIPTDISTISDEEIQEQIDSIMESYSAPVKITDRAVAQGDTLNIDYVGTVDGVEFEGGNTKGEGTDVTIGVTKYIDDFLEQLVGHMPGENFDIEVTFPDDYGNTELQGKDAVFNITINYIHGETITPELTDAFVAEKLKSSYGWETVEQMKSMIRDQLFNNAISQYVQTHIVDASEFSSVPESVVAYQADSMLAYYEQMAAYYLVDLETMLGMSADAFVEQSKVDLENQAKFSLAVQAVAETNEALAASDANVTAYFEKNFGSADYSSYTEMYGEPYIRFVVMNDTVIESLINSVVYEDPNVVLPAETESVTE